MTGRCRWLCVCAVILTASPALAQSSPPAGRIKVVTGSAFVVRAGTPSPAVSGQVIHEADSLRTGTDGHIGVLLRDDTRVSVGPDSEVRLDTFTYAPAENRLALVLKFVRGVAVYVSGRIAKLSPDAIRLETPSAIVGVRGTTLAIRVVPE